MGYKRAVQPVILVEQLFVEKLLVFQFYLNLFFTINFNSFNLINKFLVESVLAYRALRILLGKKICICNKSQTEMSNLLYSKYIFIKLPDPTQSIIQQIIRKTVESQHLHFSYIYLYMYDIYTHSIYVIYNHLNSILYNIYSYLIH